MATVETPLLTTRVEAESELLFPWQVANRIAQATRLDSKDLDLRLVLCSPTNVIEAKFLHRLEIHEASSRTAMSPRVAPHLLLWEWKRDNTVTKVEGRK